MFFFLEKHPHPPSPQAQRKICDQTAAVAVDFPHQRGGKMMKILFGVPPKVVDKIIWVVSW